MTNAFSRDEKVAQKDQQLDMKQLEVSKENYEKSIEYLLQYHIGHYIKEVDKMPMDSKPQKVVIALYGVTGSGKSTLVNYLKRIVLNEKYIEYSPVATKSRQGPMLLQCWELTENSIIFDTRGLETLSSEKQISEAVAEILSQVSGQKKQGFVQRGSTEAEEREFTEFQCALDTKPERIHLPILCIPATADAFQKRGINQIIQKLTHVNVFPVLAITKMDLAEKDENLKSKSEKEIIQMFGEEIGLSKDDIFVFKSYRSDEDCRDLEEESKAIAGLHKLFGKAERNMRFKPPKSMFRFRMHPSLRKVFLFCLVFLVTFLVSFYVATLLIFPPMDNVTHFMQ